MMGSRRLWLTGRWTNSRLTTSSRHMFDIHRFPRGSAGSLSPRTDRSRREGAIGKTYLDFCAVVHNRRFCGTVMRFGGISHVHFFTEVLSMCFTEVLSSALSALWKSWYGICVLRSMLTTQDAQKVPFYGLPHPTPTVNYRSTSRRAVTCSVRFGAHGGQKSCEPIKYHSNGLSVD